MKCFLALPSWDLEYLVLKLKIQQFLWGKFDFGHPVVFHYIPINSQLICALYLANKNLLKGTTNELSTSISFLRFLQ